MAKRGYASQKGRRESGSFFALPHAVTGTRKYQSLSAMAVKLMVDLGRQYNGSNNGDLCATWSMMKGHGWKSTSSLYRAKELLLAVEFLVVSRQGGRNKPTLFAFTWFAIDECKGKLDINPTKVPLGLWRDQARVKLIA